MNKYIRLFYVLLIVCFVTGCGYVEPNQELDADSTEQTDAGIVSTKSNTLDFDFSSNLPWSATIPESASTGWVSLSPTSGDAGDAKIVITAKSNITAVTREASMSLIIEGVSVPFVISQPPKTSTLSLTRAPKPATTPTPPTPPTVGTPKDPTTPVTPVNPNDPSEPPSPGTPGSGTPLPPAPDDAFTVSPTSFHLSPGWNSISVNINTNLDYTITISDSWIELLSSTYVKEGRLIFGVDAHYHGDVDRVGTIVIKAKMYTATITITQEYAR